MGVDERWRGITEETTSFHLDHILVLESLLYRAGDGRREEKRRGEERRGEERRGEERRGEEKWFRDCLKL